MTLGIVGCGYTGLRVADAWRADPSRSGETVRGTTRSRLDALREHGVQAHTVDLADGEGLAAFFAELDHVIHLAPPPEDDRALDAELERVVEAARRHAPKLQSYVYGSTTGAFGHQSDADWVDEKTRPGELQPRGRKRLRYEQGLWASGLPVRVVRIAAIYGPGRGMKAALERGMLLFEGGPLTSRIHVDDLAHLLVGMTGPQAPPLVIGCDDEPARSVDVAAYVCEQLGWSMPRVLSREEALRRLPAKALELRMAGRRCRSLYRDQVMGPLRYPSYREGMLQAIESERGSAEAAEAGSTTAADE